MVYRPLKGVRIWKSCPPFRGPHLKYLQLGCAFVTFAEAELCDCAVGLSVCLSVVLSVQDYSKSNQSISLKLDVMIGPTNRKNWLTFWWWFGPGYRLQIIFPLLRRCRLGDARRFISILIQSVSVSACLGFFYKNTLYKFTVTYLQSPTDFHDTQRNDWCRQGNKSTAFWEWSDHSADVQTQINPEIWIWILYHFWLSLDALVEVCALWAQSSVDMSPLWRTVCFYCLALSYKGKGEKVRGFI